MFIQTIVQIQSLKISSRAGMSLSLVVVITSWKPEMLLRSIISLYGACASSGVELAGPSCMNRDRNSGDVVVTVIST